MIQKRVPDEYQEVYQCIRKALHNYFDGDLRLTNSEWLMLTIDYQILLYRIGDTNELPEMCERFNNYHWVNTVIVRYGERLLDK